MRRRPPARRGPSASSSASRVLGIAVGAGCFLLSGIRRIRRSLEPGQDQAEFADTLQIANDEDEAHQLLQRHLERTLPATAAVVLNRNNSADRLEAVTPLPGGSPLAETLRGAEPRSCLAVRSGRTHREDGGRPALLACPVCAACPGASSCVPLTVGGEVIGSVLLSRPAPYSEAEEQRIRESVGQAAPGAGEPAQPGRRGDPRRDRRPDRAAQQAGGHRRAEADVRPGRDDAGAAGAAAARPRPLQAGQRPARATRSGTRSWPASAPRCASVLRTGTSPAATAGRSSPSCSPTPRSPPRWRSPSASGRRSPRSPCPAPTCRSPPLSASAGFPDHASTLDRLERLADAALYVAKRQGRNRVELAEEPRLR